jgi:transposase InsO family protein
MVCLAFEKARSSFYAWKVAARPESGPDLLVTSGPTASISPASSCLELSASSRAEGAAGLADNHRSLTADDDGNAIDRALQSAAEPAYTVWPRTLGKRGPKTPLSDAELLVEIRADLKASPFQGEGHRKVRARLRILRGIPVANKRVLRLMRENQLLSPYRGRIGRPLLHDGTIVTDAPNLMWGTDGTRIFTLEDGWVWVFTAIEHWNAECVGWHVIKIGTRYEALQPIAAGLTSIYGSLGPDVARGLSLRLDHGSQYTSDHFLAQVRFWGIEPSFAFVEEPQTNGVAERFNRTLKEQAIHGRIFVGIDDVRRAVSDFVTLYNDNWRLEKLGYLSPAEARRATLLKRAA